jgi:ADP-ribose pyrophosphatase YjhB (NUDIX family)
MDNIKYNSEDLMDHYGVFAVIKNNEGKILMQNHVKHGFWTIPCGKVKVGQSIEKGLKEEIFEECNLEILEFKELVNRNYQYKKKKKNVNVFSHLFEIIKYSGERKNMEPHKHSEQKFIDLEEIKKLPYISDAEFYSEMQH